MGKRSARAQRGASFDTNVCTLSGNNWDPLESSGDGKRYVRNIQPKSPNQARLMKALQAYQMVLALGPAGTGKTYLAVAAAVEALEADKVERIVLSRPAVEAGESLGFLPGDVDAKIDPYMQPLYDNLAVLHHENPGLKEELKKMMDDKQIEIAPLAYIRGRSLQRTFFIVDEAQNLTPHEVKTIITRAGEGTKIILTGDIQQIDHPYLDSMSNGLTYVINRMKGQEMYAHVTLERGVRSELAEVASALL